jgi:hypothetical protein
MVLIGDDNRGNFDTRSEEEIQKVAYMREAFTGHRLRT